MNELCYWINYKKNYVRRDLYKALSGLVYGGRQESLASINAQFANAIAQGCQYFKLKTAASFVLNHIGPDEYDQMIKCLKEEKVL